MKRTICGIFGAGLLFAALATPAAAESYTGGSDWNVQFTGQQMVSNFKSSDMDEAIYALQPGDSVLFTLALKNTGSYTTDWYMTNKVLSSLEDSQSVANGGAYTYVLTYTNPLGVQQVLYSSDSVGGEKSTAAGEGLHEATDSLKDYFFLDQLAGGESGKIALQVALEGETQGNAYQDTLAALQMNFAVETTTSTVPHVTASPAPGTTPAPTPTATPQAGVTATATPAPSSGTDSGTAQATPRVRKVYVYTSAIPQTGDSSHPALLAAVCGISGLALLVLAIVRLRKSKKR